VTACILPGKTYCLTPSIRTELEAFFGADLSAVRFAVCERLSRTPIAALTGGANLYFAPEFFEPDSESARFLLVHELAHVLQQRGRAVVDPGRGCAALVVNQRLEQQANTLAGLFCSGGRDAGARARRITAPWLAAASQRTPSQGLTLQPGIIVANAPYPGSATVDPRIANDGLYQFLAASQEITPSFTTVEALVKFITRCTGLFAKFPNTVKDPGKRPFFEKITDANVINFKKDQAVWVAEITVQTEKGSSFTIPVFSSVKRHLILSYMSNQTRARKTEASNSIVRDGGKYEQHLRRWAGLHAAALKNNLIAFGYEPNTLTDVNSEMAFKTDTTMLPNISYAKHMNGIHSFPDSGTEVRSLTPEEYHAVTVFLLWFFRTDENLVAGEKFDKIRLLSPGELQARKELEEKRKKTIGTIDENLLEFDKYKPPKDLTGTNATAEALRIKQLFDGDKKNLKYPDLLLQMLASDIFKMLVDMGKIAAIEKPLGPVTNKTGPATDEKKPYGTETANAVIRFKTHKYEVKQNIAHLSNDLVAWMIYGHVSVNAGTILTSINLTTANKATVQQQITAAHDSIKPRTTRGTALALTLEDFYKYYLIGVAENLFTTRIGPKGGMVI
jgi:hypothetical protein